FDLFFCQNSFQSDYLIRERAIVENLQPPLFVRVGDSGIKRPARTIISLNRYQPAHWSHFASPSISKRQLERTLWLIRRPCLRGIGLRPEFQANLFVARSRPTPDAKSRRPSHRSRREIPTALCLPRGSTFGIVADQTCTGKGPSHARFASATGRCRSLARFARSPRPGEPRRSWETGRLHRLLTIVPDVGGELPVVSDFFPDDDIFPSNFL